MGEFYRSVKPIHEHYGRKLARRKGGSLRGWLKKLYYTQTIYFHYTLQERNFEVSDSWPMPCTAGRTILVVDYNGDLRACELREKILNLRDVDFDFRRAYSSRAVRTETEQIVKDACWCTHVCFIHDSLKTSPPSQVLRHPPRRQGGLIRAASNRRHLTSSTLFRLEDRIIVSKMIYTIGIYHLGRRNPMSTTARLFWSGRSQAVRLPKEFRMEGEKVRIRKQGSAVVLEPIASDWLWLSTPSKDSFRTTSSPTAANSRRINPDPNSTGLSIDPLSVRYEYLHRPAQRHVAPLGGTHEAPSAIRDRLAGRGVP